MEAKELRIGNWVLFPKWHQEGYIPSTVDNIHEQGVNVSQEVCYFYNVLKPIPLTEEILLKAGFEKNDDYCSSEDEVLYHLGDFCWNMGDISYNGSDDWFKCKYVHQLQNIYFALTGEELNIEL